MVVTHRVQLPALLRELGLPLTAVEIGIAEGFNSADLLNNGIELLYMVDAWRTLNVSGDGASPQAWHDKNYEAAKQRVSVWPSCHKILRGTSEEMAIYVPDNSLGLVYLDAGHSYVDVSKDLRLWYPKLVNGGVMAGHDMLNKSYGVYQAVVDFGRPFNIIKENKDEDAGFYFFKP